MLWQQSGKGFALESMLYHLWSLAMIPGISRLALPGAWQPSQECLHNSAITAEGRASSTATTNYNSRAPPG